MLVGERRGRQHDGREIPDAVADGGVLRVQGRGGVSAGEGRAGERGEPLADHAAASGVEFRPRGRGGTAAAATARMSTRRKARARRRFIRRPITATAACCEVLLAHKADVNARDKIGATPLFAAAAYGQKGVAEILIASNVDVNAADKGGWTALHHAAISGHQPIAELLLAQQGARGRVRQARGHAAAPRGARRATRTSWSCSWTTARTSTGGIIPGARR